MASNLPKHAPKTLTAQVFKVVNSLNNMAAKAQSLLRVFPFLFDLATASVVA
jgi:hypothetical protein